MSLLHGSPAVTTEPDAQALAERYLAVRRQTEHLAAPLSGEDQVVQSMPNTSPTKWHRGHTTWFFETFLLAPSAPDYSLFDDNYGYLFNSYYEAVGERHARHQRGLLTRPSIDEIADFRSHVDEHMVRLIDAGDPQLKELIELGLHHEQQHQELLLMDIKHAFVINPLRPVYVAQDLTATPEPNRGWRSFDGGIVDIGHDGQGFSFDNELPQHQALVHPFELADSAVTNGDWLDFIADGGYDTVGLWLSEGWADRNTHGWTRPAYWIPTDDDGWEIFTLAGMKPLDLNEPVSHISYTEADAFARWAGGRLPTEFEWELAAADEPIAGNFMDSGRHHPGGPLGENSTGMFGDTWEWTASPYVGYPGFTVADGAVGEYNGKFMMNQQVLRGGCTFTAQDHLRASYRNFFPTDTRWHCSGVRLARG